jgi:glycerol uptake facilitator-like aquaporin
MYSARDKSVEAQKFRRKLFAGISSVFLSYMFSNWCAFSSGAIVGEFVGTFVLMFVICCTAIQTQGDGLKVCVAAAAVFIALVYIMADISGANFNPAVSVSLRFAGKLSNRKLLSYIFAQCLGCILAMSLLVACYKDGHDLLKIYVVIAPTGDQNTWDEWWRVMLKEICLSFVFIFIIFALAADRLPDKDPLAGSASLNKVADYQFFVFTPSSKNDTGFVPICIGLGLISCALAGGVFNPARVFGPAVLSGNFNQQSAYWVGDFLGGMFAGLLQRLFVLHFSMAHKMLLKEREEENRVRKLHESSRDHQFNVIASNSSDV